MKATHNLISSISVVLFFLFESFEKFSPILFSGFNSGIIICTFPFSVLVVDIYVAENSG